MNKLIKQVVLLYCIIMLSFFWSSVVLSQSPHSDTTELEKRIKEKRGNYTQAAKNTAMQDLTDIKNFLDEGGWEIDVENGKIISIDKKLKEEITKTQKNIKSIFSMIAKDIENDNTVNIVIGSNGMRLPQSEQKRQDELKKYRASNNISLSSQLIAIKTFYVLNQELVDSAERETNSKKKKEWYLTQSIFVYEFASILVDMIDNLNNNSLEQIRRICDEAFAEYDKRDLEYKKMMAEGNSKRKQETGEWLLKESKTIRVNWENIIKGIGEQDDWRKNLQEKKKDFEESVELAVHQAQLIVDGMAVDLITEQVQAIKTLLELDAPILLRMDGTLFAVPMSDDIEISTKLNIKK